MGDTKHTLARLLSANLAAYTARPVLAALLPQLGPALALDHRRRGWLGSTFSFASLACALPCAVLADRLHARAGRRGLLLVGAALWLAALALCGSGGFETLLIGQALLAAGQAAMQAPKLALVRDLYGAGAETKRDLAVGLLEASLPLGGLLGYALGAIAGLGGWRLAFFAAAGVCAIGCLPLLGLVDPLRGRAERRALPSEQPRYLALLTKRTVVLDALAMGCFGWAVGGFAYWMPTFLHEARGVSATTAPLGFGVIAGVVGGGAAFAAGLAVQRLSAERSASRAPLAERARAASTSAPARRGWGLRLCALLALLAAPLVLALAATRDATISWLLVGALVALLIATLSPSNAALTHVVPGSHLGMLSAVSSIVVNAGEGLGRWHIGAVAADAGFEAAMRLQVWPVALAGVLWLGASYTIGAEWQCGDRVARRERRG